MKEIYERCLVIDKYSSQEKTNNTKEEYIQPLTKMIYKNDDRLKMLLLFFLVLLLLILNHCNVPYQSYLPHILDNIFDDLIENGKIYIFDSKKVGLNSFLLKTCIPYFTFNSFGFSNKIPIPSMTARPLSEALLTGIPNSEERNSAKPSN